MAIGTRRTDKEVDSSTPRPHAHKQAGLTLVEVLIAVLVLVIAAVGVAQLVPVAVSLDMHNRRDSTAMVIAQREMDAMVDQGISNITFTDPNGLVCPAASVCNLGNPAAPNAWAGSPFVMVNNMPLINYAAATVAGYNFQYSDPDDPAGASYDIRWAVMTFANGAAPVGRRIIVGVRKVGGNTPLLPVTLDSMVEK